MMLPDLKNCDHVRLYIAAQPIENANCPPSDQAVFVLHAIFRLKKLLEMCSSESWKSALAIVQCVSHSNKLTPHACNVDSYK